MIEQERFQHFERGWVEPTPVKPEDFKMAQNISLEPDPNYKPPVYTKWQKFKFKLRKIWYSVKYFTLIHEDENGTYFGIKIKD